jgi:hypothetical protein
MTCNKFLQNWPKKRNPTYHIKTTDRLFLFFFWQALSLGTSGQAGLSREHGRSTQGVTAAGRTSFVAGGGEGQQRAPPRALTPGRKGQPRRLKRTPGVKPREFVAL